MKALINHLVRHNLAEIASKSFLNCHCVGLHSIMLMDSPTAKIRVFVADRNHEMHRNFIQASDPMTIAYHAHHCDITLHVLTGTIQNIIASEKGSSPVSATLKKFNYSSAITGEGIKFTPAGETTLRLAEHYLEEGDHVHMKADELHTVACWKDEIAAWMVYEGKEDSQYEPVCYSNADLDKADFSELYIKMTEEQVLSVLRSGGLL